MRLAITNLSIVQQDLDFRIDADFYSHPFRQKFLELKRELHFSTLKKETDFIGSGHTPYKHNMKDGDIPFITVECVGDLEFSYNKTKRITNEQYGSEYKNKIIKKGAVICTIKRRICKAYPFLSETKKMALNQDVALIYPKEELLSGFLAVYFNCSFGQGFADSLKTEQMNPYISLVNLAKLPVPLLDIIFQQRIEDIVLLSQQIKSQSERKYKDAQYLLLSELGLFNWKPKHQLSFIKNYSETEQAERIDAEYYQPKYDEIVKAIKNYSNGWDTLENLVNLKTQNYIPKNKQEYKYIELSNIANNGEITGCTEEEGQDLPSRARRRIVIGDVIVSSIEGSLASIALVNDNYDQALCSTGFYVINSKTFSPETLLVLLKSKAGQLQLKKGCNGTILTAINKDEFSKIILPKITKSTQTKIQQKVSDSFALRKQSKHLLECAKKAVEMAIEKDEKTAIDWLELQIS